LNQFKEFPLTQEQQDLLNVGEEFLNFYEQKVVPELKKFHEKNILPLIDQEGNPLSNIPLEIKKAHHLMYCNNKLLILDRSVKLLTICGFGDQGNNLCRTMFDIWLDSQYVGLSHDPDEIKELIEKIENWGKIQWCQQFKEIAEFDKKWAVQVRNDWEKNLESTGKTLDEEIQEIEELEQNLYNKGKGKIFHWSGVEAKAKWERIKTGESYESLKRAYLTVYKHGSQSVHGSNFWVLPELPSDDKLRSTALAGSFQCFYGQTEDLQHFLDLGLEDKFIEFTEKHINKLNPEE